MVVARGDRVAYTIVLVGSIAYALLMFIWFSLAAYLPAIIGELSLSGTQAGIAVGAVPATYVPLALFSGLFVDRTGPGRSLAAGAVTFGIAQAARSQASGPLTLVATTVLIGLGATTVTFGLPKLVSLLFPADRTGTPSAVYLIAANAGAAGAFAVGRPVLGPALGGWRPLFFWSGAVAVTYGVGWLLLATRLGIDARNSAESAAADAVTLIGDLRAVIAHRELQLVVGVGTMYLFVVHGMQGWLQTMLESRGLPTSQAGLTTSAFVAAVVVGILVVPAVADRLGYRRAALTVCGVGVTVGVAGLISLAGSPATFAGIVVAGLGAGGISPLLRAIPPALEGIGPRLTGTAVGFVFAIGEIGGFVGPLLIGVTQEMTGSFVPGFGMLSLAGVVVTGLGWRLARAR